MKNQYDASKAILEVVALTGCVVNNLPDDDYEDLDIETIQLAKLASRELNVFLSKLTLTGKVKKKVKRIINKIEKLAGFDNTILEIYMKMLNEAEEEFLFLRIDDESNANGELIITTIDSEHEFVVDTSERGIDIVIVNINRQEKIAAFVEDEIDDAVALIARMLDGFNDVV